MKKFIDEKNLTANFEFDISKDREELIEFLQNTFSFIAENDIKLKVVKIENFINERN